MGCFKPSNFSLLYTKEIMIAKTPFSKLYICKKENKEYVLKIQSIKHRQFILKEISILQHLSNNNYTTHLIYSEWYYFNYFLVFDKIHGITLLDYFKKTGTKRINKDNNTIKHQLLRGFSFIQTKGIIHRDIKPDNIMIDYLLKITIIDFGLSVYQKDIYLLQHNEFSGTYQYVCPEMYRGIFYNASCDTWSLGVLLYYLFYNTYPYKVNSKKVKQCIMFKVLPECIKLLNLKDHIVPCIKDMLKIDYRPLIKDLDM